MSWVIPPPWGAADAYPSGMTSVERPAAAEVERASIRWERVERWGRLFLALTWLSLVVATVVVGHRQSSLQELEAQLRSGDVTQVRISEGLQPGETGMATVWVAWRDGLVNHSARVAEHRPERRQSRSGGQASEDTVRGDLRTHLRAIDPDVRFEAAPFVEESNTMVGWEAPEAFAFVVLVLFVVALVLLVKRSGPTWRATRWAWFWVFGLAPVGVPAFLLLGGPCAGVRPPRAAGARLTGGWAFLIVTAVSWAFEQI
jgi:hypothetical protein